MCICLILSQMMISLSANRNSNRLSSLKSIQMLHNGKMSLTMPTYYLIIVIFI